jgi:uncharacterized membrane protein YdjX (TVP38/TMEM64 family)
MGGRKRVAILAVIAALLVACAFLLPVRDWGARLVDWLRVAGPKGAAAYFGVYLVGAILLVPGSLLTATAGFVYGPVLGALLAWPASLIASSVTFVLGRTILRGPVSRRLARRKKWAAIDRAVSRKGWKIVALLRLSPVLPANLMNYGLGLTGMKLRDYVLGGAIGSIPSTILYAYIGSAAHSAAEIVRGERAEVTPAERALFWGGLVATVVVVLIVARITTSSLRRELRESRTPT